MKTDNDIAVASSFFRVLLGAQDTAMNLHRPDQISALFQSASSELAWPEMWDIRRTGHLLPFLGDRTHGAA